MMILHGNVSSEYIFDFKKTHHRRKVMNKIIKINIIFCVVLVVAFVYSATAHASIAGMENENVQESSLPIASEGAKQSTDDHISASTEVTSMIALSFKPDKYRRTVIIGDLPTDHDPSLVLRKGRSIAVRLINPIKNESHLKYMFFKNMCSFNIKEDIYDDSGQNLLMPSGAMISCYYKISEEKDKMRIDIVAEEMMLDLLRDISVQFSNPPRCTTNRERKIEAISVVPFRSTDVSKLEEENLRYREKYFTSPVIHAELVFGIESEDRTSVYGKVVFDKNTSGDRTIFIDSGYRINLQVKKDILFSGHFIDWGRLIDWDGKELR
jgi:hypothetical protein